MSNSLDPEQDRLSFGPDLEANCFRLSVGPDLDTNYLQRLSADDKLPLAFFFSKINVHTVTVSDNTSVLLWIQNVCKGYQQTTKFAASMVRSILEVPELLHLIAYAQNPFLTLMLA